MSRIVQTLRQPADDAGPFQDLPLDQGSRVATELVGTGLDAEGTVERGLNLR